MQISLFNAKNPNGKRVPVSVSIEHVDVRKTNDGELIYLVTVSTGARDINGVRINTVYINDVTDRTFKSELSKALSTIASQIDWGALEDDTYPPLIVDMSPIRDEENVHIDRNVTVTLKDPFPASFIDISTLKFKVNGIDVTPEIQISEKDNHVYLNWNPVRIKD